MRKASRSKTRFAIPSDADAGSSGLALVYHKSSSSLLHDSAATAKASATAAMSSQVSGDDEIGSSILDHDLPDDWIGAASIGVAAPNAAASTDSQFRLLLRKHSKLEKNLLNLQSKQEIAKSAIASNAKLSQEVRRQAALLDEREQALISAQRALTSQGQHLSDLQTKLSAVESASAHLECELSSARQRSEQAQQTHAAATKELIHQLAQMSVSVKRQHESAAREMLDDRAQVTWFFFNATWRILILPSDS